MAAYIFDAEFSKKKRGEIVEAAWIRFTDAPDLAGDVTMIPPHLSTGPSFCQRYKPAEPMEFGAIAVHHILPHQLDGCPPSSTFALPDDCSYIIGHSIDNDWEAAGSPAHIKRIDTHAIAQWLWPDATGYSQTALVYMLEGPTEAVRDRVRDAHSAITDSWLNYTLIWHILKLKPEIQTWEQLWAYSEECRIPRTCPLKRWEGVLVADMDDGAIDWCLRQYWIDDYFRKGLERVLERRHSAFLDHDVDEDFDHDDGDDMLPAQIESRYPNDVMNEAPSDDHEDECAACQREFHRRVRGARH